MNQVIPVVNADKAAIMRALAQQIPMDKYGLPQFVYRNDFVPDTILQMTKEDQFNHLSNASITLNYDEGFPTMPSGEPFWHQLDWEPTEVYELFHKYLTMVEEPETPLRVLAYLATITQTDLPLLQKYFHSYWWKSRARAYDLFKTVLDKKEQRRRIMAMNQNHQTYAVGFIKMCHDYMKKQFEGFLAGEGEHDLTPAVVAKMLDQMMKAERVAMGLPAHGLSGSAVEARQDEGRTLERSLADLAEQVLVVEDTHRTDDIREILKNPAAIQRAQELIIELARAQEGNRNRAGDSFLDRYEADELESDDA